MTEDQFRERFPYASQATIQANIASGVISGPNTRPVISTGDSRIQSGNGQVHGQPHARLRQRTGPKLNKTEAAFFDWLKARFDPKDIRAQAVTLVIGNGVRYTVDFTNLRAGLAWETKGHMRDDAAVKIKVAASLYPEIKFHLVTRSGPSWSIQEILP